MKGIVRRVSVGLNQAQWDHITDFSKNHNIPMSVYLRSLLAERIEGVSSGVHPPPIPQTKTWTITKKTVKEDEEETVEITGERLATDGMKIELHRGFEKKNGGLNPIPAGVEIKRPKKLEVVIK